MENMILLLVVIYMIYQHKLLEKYKETDKGTLDVCEALSKIIYSHTNRIVNLENMNEKHKSERV